MCSLMRQTAFRVSDTNRTVRLKKMPRGLIFLSLEVEGLHYPCSKNKDADQLFLSHIQKAACSHNVAQFT